MAAKIIVSYDETDNDRDALALGRLLAYPGASVALAYVRHACRSRPGREARGRARRRGTARGWGRVRWRSRDSQVRGAQRLDPRRAEGARRRRRRAQGIVFGSAYRTTPGHVYPQLSAERLMEPRAARGRARTGRVRRPRRRRGSRRSPRSTRRATRAQPEPAESLAKKLGATVEARPSPGAGLLVVGSKTASRRRHRRWSVRPSAYLIELSRCPTLVVPRGAPLVVLVGDARRSRPLVRAVPEALQHLGRGGRVQRQHHHGLAGLAVPRDRHVARCSRRPRRGASPTRRIAPGTSS